MNRDNTQDATHAKIRLLVADDHSLVRLGLRAMADAAGDMVVVAEARNGREAIDAHRTHRPDIAILDVRMPVCSGLEAIVAIRQADPAAKLIALSHYDGDEDIQRCLDAGAWTYLLKRSVEDELAACIRATHRGERRLPPEVLARLALRDTRAGLSDRERQVLELLTRGKSNKEIAAALGVSVNTINTHVATILLKLGADDRTEAATIALQRGFVHLD